MSFSEDPRVLIDRALSGDPASVRALVDRLSSVITKRVGATLRKRIGRDRADRDAADVVQEVFASLFQADGKALRAWDPARGMSLDSFVGLLAQHQTISLLRSGRIAPWREELVDGVIDDVEGIGMTSSPPSPEAVTASREALQDVLDRLRGTLSPRGLELFQRLIIEEEPIDDLIVRTGMNRDAIYQWKSRILRTLRTLVPKGDAPVLSETAATERIDKGVPRA